MVTSGEPEDVMRTSFLTFVFIFFFSFQSFAKIIQNDDIQTAISEIQHPDKVKLIYIFSPLCTDCLENINRLTKLNKKYPKDELTITGFIFSKKAKTPKSLTNKYKKIGFNIYHYSQDDSIDIFKTSGFLFNSITPHVVLMNKDGFIVAEGRYDIEALEMTISYLTKK